MVKAKQLVKRHKKALALWAFWLVLAALFIFGLLPRPAIFYGESMQPTMGPIGIALLDTQTHFEELHEGDIIVFSNRLRKQSVYDKDQSIILAHRVYYIDKKRGTIVTSGDNNKKQCQANTIIQKDGKTSETLKTKCQPIDIENVTKNQYLGKVVWWFP